MANPITPLSENQAFLDKLAQYQPPDSSTPSATSPQDQIDALEQQKDNISKLQDANNKTIEELTKQVEAIKAQIIQQMEDAINEGNDFTEQQQENINAAVDKTVQKYLKGEITKDELLKTLGATLSTTEADISAKLDELILGKSDLATALENTIFKICELAEENEELAEKLLQIDEKIAECEAQIAASSNCEPQGFQVQNADGSMTQYDFFVDRDGNGDLTNMMEFLGATADKQGKDGWTEMQAYDANKDGTITLDEMQQGNANNVNNGQLMVVVTNISADGTKTQTIQTLEEAFGNSQLEINAIKDSQTKAGVGPIDFNNNKYENDMLGTFGVKFNGQNLTGYQTMDDVDYLNDNYSFTRGSAEAGTKVGNIVVPSQEKDYSELDAETEKALISSTIDTITNAMNTQVDVNQTVVNGTSNSLISEEEVQETLDEEKENEEPNKESEETSSNSKPKTEQKTNFKFLAYTSMVDILKKDELEEDTALSA